MTAIKTVYETALAALNTAACGEDTPRIHWLQTRMHIVTQSLNEQKCSWECWSKATLLIAPHTQDQIVGIFVLWYKYTSMSQPAKPFIDVVSSTLTYLKRLLQLLLPPTYVSIYANLLNWVYVCSIIPKQNQQVTQVLTSKTRYHDSCSLWQGRCQYYPTVNDANDREDSIWDHHWLANFRSGCIPYQDP